MDISTPLSRDIIFNPSQANTKYHEAAFLVVLLGLVVTLFAFFYFGLNNLARQTTPETQMTPRFVHGIV